MFFKFVKLVIMKIMIEKVLLRGIGVSSGIAKGKVKIILTSKDARKFNKGDILVASTVSPFFSLTILKASAIITEVGGSLSHPAIFSRELGIPCITGALNATKVLKDNQEIIVDANKGIIYEV